MIAVGDLLAAIGPATAAVVAGSLLLARPLDLLALGEGDAKRLGADHFYATQDPATFEKLQKAFDLIICTVSTGIDWNQYVGTLKVDGTMVLVGVPDAPVPVNAFPLILGRRALAGSASVIT